MISQPVVMKYETARWSKSSKTINWSADNFQINHVTSVSWHMSLRYGHVILVSSYPVLTAVNWPFCEWPIYKKWIWKTRLRHPSLPFDSLPYPTLTICRRERTYVRSFNHVTTKRKEVDHILWAWGSMHCEVNLAFLGFLKQSSSPLLVPARLSQFIS